MAGTVVKQKGAVIIPFMSVNMSNVFKEPVANESDSGLYGGRSRSRTYDRPVMSRWLYQLSYTPLQYDETYYNKRTGGNVNEKKLKIEKIGLFRANIPISSTLRIRKENMGIYE